MDGELPLSYYDRSLDPQPEVEERAGFLVPLDVFGLLSPAWIVVATIAVATPVAAVLDGWNSAAHWDIAIGFYGLIFAVYLMIPWGASYLLWRVIGLATGSTITLAAGTIGIVVSVSLVAAGVLTWPAFPIALFSWCGMVSSAIWRRAGR